MGELIQEGRVVQTRSGAVPQYKRYLDEMPGTPVQNLWTDLPVLNKPLEGGPGIPYAETCGVAGTHNLGVEQSR